MAASLSERLARHRARRRQGHPIVSAWCAPWPFEPDEAVAVLQAPVVSSDRSDLKSMSQAWMLQWLGHNRLEASLSAHLNDRWAQALNVTTERAMTVLAETSTHDREPLIAQAESNISSPRLARLLRWWVQHPQRNSRDGVLALNKGLGQIDPQLELPTLVTIAEVCPAEDRPWLVAVPPAPLPDDALEWFASTSLRMQTVAQTMPDWPVLVAAPEPLWRALPSSDNCPESVQKLQAALLEPLEGISVAEVVDFFDLDTNLRRLLRGRSSEQPDSIKPVAPVEKRTIESLPPPAAPEPPEVSKPDPKSVLLERLEQDPTTAGAFVADARLEGGPGGRRIDVPLYAADPQIAIEIDESFAAASLEAYRRNRTKDLWLQRRGLLVIRVLADDIQDRLQDIALLIRDVVRERRIRGRRR